MIFYAEMKGTITQKFVKTPDEGKPHIFIQVLQSSTEPDQKVTMPECKDFDLNGKYEVGQAFHAFVRISDWSVNDRSGASCIIIKNLAAGAQGNIKKGEKL